MKNRKHEFKFRSSKTTNNKIRSSEAESQKFKEILHSKTKI